MGGGGGECGGLVDVRVSGASKKGNGDGGECGKGSREMVKRGEDERHLPRRGYVGRQMDDRDGVMFCFTRDREQTAGGTDGIAAVVRSSRVR